MLKRTHNCGELREQHVGQIVTLNGWVNAYRDHGEGLIFVDLRDRYGLTQLVFDTEDASKSLLELADKIRNEDVVAARGVVRIRDGAPNPKLGTGKIEIVVTECEILSKTAKPPFQPWDDKGQLPGEEIRLRHRYMDLRRPRMQEILAKRHRIAKVTRDYFDEMGFLEVETPMLCRSTPEGARDFLVPSRLQPGMWYALPQSPQLFKQILMVSGCDRYLQIVRCFRDEDPRADRQAEFTQIDLEMSFVDRDVVLDTMEGFARRLWKEVEGVELPPFPRMTYRQAMERYGIDRPDTRYGLEIIDVSDIARRSDFKVFAEALEKPRGVVKCIRVPGGADKLSRKMTDGYSEWVRQYGAGGIAVTKVSATGGLESGIAKFVEPIAGELVTRMEAGPGDTLLFAADPYTPCTKAMGELRQKIARDLNMIPEGKWNFLWVVDFPMFEFDAAADRFFALHHPFTAPTPEYVEQLMALDPKDHSPANVDRIESLLSAGYDMVCNGSEIGGGSIRIHRQDVQSQVFSLLGLSPEQARQKFSFLLEALSFGAPPHGGIAFGLDRLVMHLCRTDNIRDVIAFPKTQTGADLMSQAPNLVDEDQLKELHVASTWTEGH
ncbi:MAG: aspartate--tRNA ligase [Leptolyngbya sp. PLA3]|nr:MAG: aspartate--tRNA ligase [Cyanobacteria bacterium CYA]MCE7969486.1 aspartate--tRNA ligase [Leptolyngbya sp. PL-A3]